MLHVRNRDGGATLKHSRVMRVVADGELSGAVVRTPRGFRRRVKARLVSTSTFQMAMLAAAALVSTTPVLRSVIGPSSGEVNVEIPRGDVTEDLGEPIIETVRMLQANGQPAEGAKVIVYARSQNPESTGLLELDTAFAGKDGVAVLRGSPSIAVRRLFNHGLIDLVFIASGDGQVALPHMMTAEYIRDGGSPSGRWNLLKDDVPDNGDGGMSANISRETRFTLGPHGGIVEGEDVSASADGNPYHETTTIPKRPAVAGDGS